MATPTAVGTSASDMINLVKSPDTSTWVLQLCTTRVTQNESNAKFRIRMVPQMKKVLLNGVTYPCNYNPRPFTKNIPGVLEPLEWCGCIFTLRMVPLDDHCRPKAHYG